MEGSGLSFRRLAWACAGFSAGIFLSACLPEDVPLVIPALAAVLAALLAHVSGRAALRRMTLFFAMGAAGLAWCAVYGALVYAPVTALDGSTVTAEMTALGRTQSLDGGGRTEVRIETADAPGFTAVLYDFDGGLPALSPGDTLEGEISLRRADRMHGREYTGYIGRGVLMLAYPAGEIARSGSGGPLYLPRSLAYRIADMTDRLFAADTAPFVKALLTGETDDYYDDAATARAVAHAGLAHVISVSGMHVSFVVGLLLVLGRRRAMLLGIPAVVLFMLMMGGRAPVTRACVMYAMLLAAPLARRDYDAPTALSLILAVLLLVNPHAAYSISLQLSFAAMAGILLCGGRITDCLEELMRPEKRGKHVRRLLRSLAAVAGTTLSATIFTAPLAAVHFGYFSLYSVFTNLLTYFVISAVFILGYLACALGALLPAAGAALAAAVSVGVRYVLAVCRAVDALPLSAVYMDNPVYAAWLLVTVLLFGAAWLMQRKTGFRPLTPASLSIIALCFCVLTVSAQARRDPGRVTVLDVGQGACTLLMAGDSTAVVDCGGLGRLENAGETAAGYLLSRGRDSIGALVLTHLHADHANGAAALMQMVHVEKLLLAPGLDDSDGQLAEIEAAAAECGTEIVRIGSDLTVTMPGLELQIFAPGEAGGENERCAMVRAAVGDFDVFITGDAGMSAERAFLGRYAAENAELLVVGHHGSAGSTSLELMEALRPQYSVISVGYNSYGHPTAEAMERARGFGAALYRTDLHGNVTFKLGGNDG